VLLSAALRVLPGSCTGKHAGVAVVFLLLRNNEINHSL